MAHEELIVIGFGVVLAVVSVALFWAHVRRINAPNKADPKGILVEIANLGDAMREDQAAAARRIKYIPAAAAAAAYRGGKRKTTAKIMVDHSGGDICDVAVGEEFVVDGKYGGSGGRGGGVFDKQGAACGGGRAALEGTACGADEVTVRGTSKMLLPSPAWAEAIVKHADVKRKTLRAMVKPGGEGRAAVGWESVWTGLAPVRRRKLLQDVRDELVHAVSAYVGQDEAIFSTVCPELSVDDLGRERRGVSGLSRLVRQCLDGKLPDPKSRAHAAVQAALAKAATLAAENIPKNERGPVRAFLPTFRKLCYYSFCIGALEAIESGRADGSKGPTLSSFLGALLRTGCSGVLVWVFFHGLEQMSSVDYVATDGTESALPAHTASAGFGGEKEGAMRVGGAVVEKGRGGGALRHVLEEAGLLVDLDEVCEEGGLENFA